MLFSGYEWSYDIASLMNVYEVIEFLTIEVNNWLSVKKLAAALEMFWKLNSPKLKMIL